MDGAITAGGLAEGSEGVVVLSEALAALSEGLVAILTPEVVIPLLALAAASALGVFAISNVGATDAKCPMKEKEGAAQDSGTDNKGGGDGGKPEDTKPKRVTNPKHNPNSASPEPENVDELYDQSIPDDNGVRWAKDKNGVIHRFSKPSNGETHWNGSTAGPDPIQEQNIPSKIRRALK